MKASMKLLAVGLLAASALWYGGCGQTEQKDGADNTGKIKVGVVQIMQHGALDAANRGFIDGLKERGYDAGKIEVDQQNAQGDQSNLKSIVSRFRNAHPDLICAISTPAAQAVANEIHDVPIVGAAITDYEAAKLVKSNEKPGGNVTGVSDLVSVEAQMDFALQALKDVERVGVIYCSSEVNSEVQAQMVKDYCTQKGLAVEERTVNSVNDIQQVAESLVGKCDMIYVPTDNVLASSIPTLVKVTDANRIPVIVGAADMVKDGALAALSLDFYTHGKQAGYMAADILDGKGKPADMPVEHPKAYGKVINKKALDLLGITLSDDIKNGADMI